MFGAPFEIYENVISEGTRRSGFSAAVLCIGGVLVNWVVCFASFAASLASFAVKEFDLADIIQILNRKRRKEPQRTPRILKLGHYLSFLGLGIQSV
jgi:hypothetical protein